MDYCVNCRIAIGRSYCIGRRVLVDEGILSVFRQWRTLQSITSENIVCQPCWDLAQDVVLGRRPIFVSTQDDHPSVCLHCGCSLSVDETSHICLSCWILADRAVHMRTGPSTSSQTNLLPAPSSVDVSDGQLDENYNDILHELENVSIQPDKNQGDDDEHELSVELHSPGAPIVEPVQQHPEPLIVLPDYVRAVESAHQCFIEGCQRTELYRVPQALRNFLLNEHNYYVPQNNRLCDIHLVTEAWDFLDSSRSNYLQTFTGRHIQDMFTF